jgi:hypothetical protein
MKHRFLHLHAAILLAAVLTAARAAEPVVGAPLYVATDGPVTITITRSSSDAGLVRMWYGTDGNGSSAGAVMQSAALSIGSPVGTSVTTYTGAIAGVPFGAPWPAGTDLVFQMVAFGALVSPQTGEYREIPTQRTGSEFGRSVSGLPLASVVFGPNNTAEIAFMTPRQNWKSPASFDQAGFRIQVSNVTGAFCD